MTWIYLQRYQVATLVKLLAGSNTIDFSCCNDDGLYLLDIVIRSCLTRSDCDRIDKSVLIAATKNPVDALRDK